MMVKPGDRVWISVNVGLTMPDGTAWYTDLRGAPLKGNFDANHLPDSPCLPAVARFLAASPQVGHELSAALDLIDDHVEIAMPAPCMSRLRALVAALATAAADGGAG